MRRFLLLGVLLAAGILLLRCVLAGQSAHVRHARLQRLSRAAARSQSGRDAAKRPRGGAFGRRRHGGSHGAERVGASAEVGYRYRTEDIPADMFFNGSLFVPAGDRVIVGVDYRMVNATSGLDIGVPPFSPARFPEVQEDIHLVGGRVIINATDIVSVNGLFGKVVKGRNTASSNVFGVSLGFAFDTF